MSECPICKKLLKGIKLAEEGAFYNCKNCGQFFMPTSSLLLFSDLITNNFYDKNKLRAYLYYNKIKGKTLFIGEEKAYSAYLRNTLNNKSSFVSHEIVNSWYPKAFSEKVDKILLKIHQMSAYDGAYVAIYDEVEELFFCFNTHSQTPQQEEETARQIDYMFHFLVETGYLENLGSWTVQLKPKALERIYELQKYQSINKNIFVSMAFNDKTKETREAIRQGIIKAEYSPEFLDEIIHNRQIVPEMFRLIRESRFLILEISDPNYGAYYEAGYALGLNKEVIVCCRRDVFERKDYDCNKENGQDEDKKCWYMQKALKPHFDILQKQILVWDDYTDLTKKLEEWIRELSTR